MRAAEGSSFNKLPLMVSSLVVILQGGRNMKPCAQISVFATMFFLLVTASAHQVDKRDAAVLNHNIDTFERFYDFLTKEGTALRFKTITVFHVCYQFSLRILIS